MTPGGLLLRDRAIVLAGLAVITGLSGAYTWRLASDASALCMVSMNPWRIADMLAVFVMWAAMMVAMMIPSASPMILAFAGVNRARKSQSLSHVPTIAFVAGYVAAWAGFSIAATVAQSALHSAALVSPMGKSTSRILGGVLLIGTGIFQWTPLKNTCLRRCRSPLGFILTEWREGVGGAFQMGLRHGVFCIGCCWLLMALLFVAGVMNLWWIATIAAAVLLEKVAPGGLWIARFSGIVLLAWGGWVLSR